MGLDPAPFIANLSLYACEHKFQAKLSKENYNAAKQNNNNSRYIDDINTVNNKVFEDQIKLIYPPEITCNRENTSDLAGHFLDIDIAIVNDKFVTKVFDKRDTFEIKIVKFPSVLSNIPDSVIYSVFVSQTLRAARICSLFKDFIEIFKILVQNFKAKGCLTKFLIPKAKKTFLTNEKTFAKFNTTCRHFLEATF